MPLQNLQNKKVLITGASHGLGKSLAIRLAKEKAHLILLARDEKLLQELQHSLEKSTKVEYVVCDLRAAHNIKKISAELIHKYSALDILVNNAGIWFEGPLASHSAEQVTNLFTTNIIGLINITRELLPLLTNAKSAQILNISSSAAIDAGKEWGVYTATKFAVRGFSDSLKMELSAKGIKVMAYYPEGMTTDIFVTSGFGKVKEKWMMAVDDNAEILTFMLKQPEDVNINHIEVSKFYPVK